MCWLCAVRSQIARQGKSNPSPDSDASCWIKNESAAGSFECLRLLIPVLPFYRILNGRFRGPQKFVEPTFDDCVALARCLLETRPIENLNGPAVVADEAGRLHGLCRQCHRLPIGAQDMRQKFVGIGQQFDFRPVMHHEKPTAHSFFRRVYGIASDSLLDLRQQRFRIADEEIADVFAVLEFQLQQFDGTANHAALQLHNAPIEGGPAVHGGEQTECPLAPYVRRLNG